MMNKDYHHTYGPEDINSFMQYTSKIIERNRIRAKGNFKVFYDLCKADGIVIDDPEVFVDSYLKKKKTTKPKTPYKKVHDGHQLYRITPAN